MEESKHRKAQEAVLRKEEARARKLEIEVAPQHGADAAMVEAKAAAEDDEDALLDYASDPEGADADGDAHMDDTKAGANPMAALLASARARAADFDPDERDADAMAESDDGSDSDVDSWASFDATPARDRESHRPKTPTSHRTAIDEVISSSDILLYVLDARDPLGTRSAPLERRVLSDPSKRIFFILNKVDLVPTAVATKWLTHLRRSYPTLPLLSTTSAVSGAKTFSHGAKNWTPQATSAALLHALKAYAAQSKFKRSVTVGVLGYPNVGKSSVINAVLSRLGRKNDACPVGAEAGVTTAMRIVKLDGRLRLLDAPGVVFAGDKDVTGAATSGSGLAKNSSKSK